MHHLATVHDQTTTSTHGLSHNLPLPMSGA